MRAPLICCFLFETQIFFLDKLPKGEYNMKNKYGSPEDRAP